jgi:acetaldehyde dehydrogenase (acetylating)
MTLGCGGYGGNITSDNISPRHLLNIKRLAYEIAPAAVRHDATRAAAGTPPLPKAPVTAAPPGLTAESLSRRIDQFLASKGYAAAPVPASTAHPVTAHSRQPPPAAAPAAAAAEEKAADFVCEDDVRQAMRQGRKITIGERSIVTPAARDLGEQHRVFTQAAWPR